MQDAWCLKVKPREREFKQFKSPVLNVLTIRELSVEVGGSYGTCQAIPTQDLNMRRLAAKFVPRILTAEQKEWRLSVATNMLQEAESDENFMGQIITGDETWVYGYDPKT